MDKHVQQPTNASSSIAPSIDKRSTARDLRRASNILTLEHILEDRKTLVEYDERIQDQQQLAQLYGEWMDLVGARRSVCMHALLLSLLWILGIVVLVIVGNVLVEKVSPRLVADRRRVAAMRLLGRFVVQAAGLLLILVVRRGSPKQLSTIIAFAGAGLTVALRDFIVAFLGWSSLWERMGFEWGTG